MMSRMAELSRRTAETSIELKLDLDGVGRAQIDTSVGFLDHMLTLLSAHSLVDLQIKAGGDTEVDFHHLTEDVGICLGQAMSQALGDRRGIRRYGSIMLPMDETLVAVAIDICGRSSLGYALDIRRRRVGDFDTELLPEFMQALAANLGAAIHLRQLCGRNTHHIIEAAFKGLGQALRQALEPDPRNDGVPSTKGVI